MRPVILFLLLALAPAPALAQTVSLNGEWSFLPDPGRSLTVTALANAPNARRAKVPGSWQSQFEDLRDYAGVAWYWRSVDASLPADRVALLRFGAVDYRAEVYVNGQPAGRHEGGFLPFELDVTSLWKSGTNVVALRVVDAGGSAPEVEGIRFAEIPHGKQDWYVQTSGPWQDVSLELRPPTRLGTTHISAAADGRFTIDVPIVRRESTSGNDVRVSASISDRVGRKVWEDARVTGSSDLRVQFTSQLTNPQLWSPEDPTLYRLQVRLGTSDAQSLRFGFRTFESRDGRFLLNGAPIYLRGALDQDFYPDTIYSIPSAEFVKAEMLKAKALGLNLLRHHIKVPDPKYLDAADEAGVLIWYDVPNWDTLTDDSRRRGLETLRGMVERDWNHPSIVILTIINEAWGIDIKNPVHRSWLREAYQHAKTIVPSWLVVDNSPCCDNYHLVTDIADFHQYNVIPDHAANFRGIVGELATRPPWLFSRNGGASERGDEPLVLSEFGNWGLPRIPATKPWWWGRMFQNNPITQPEGIEDRFKAFGYDSIFADLTTLTDATEWHQFRALKHEIETLRAQGSIQGYVITEFTDINWEANGLLDMWRRPKLHATELARLQQDDLLMVQVDRRNYTSGERARAAVLLSRYGNRGLGDFVTWTIEGTAFGGQLAVPKPAAGSVVEIGTIEFDVPPVVVPERRRLVVRELSGTTIVRENDAELFFYPASPLLVSDVFATVHDPAGDLRALSSAMVDRGHTLRPAGEGSLLVSSVFDDTVKRALRSGATVVLLPAKAPVTIAPGLDIAPRAGSSLDGNWITSFLWARNDRAPFKPVAFERLAGFEIETAAPAHVVRGVPPEYFPDVLSGIFYGWLHSNVATLVQASAGRGRLLICTYDLAGTYGRDPYATHLFEELLRYAASAFQPSFRIPVEP